MVQDVPRSASTLSSLRMAGTIREVVRPAARWRATIGDERREGTLDGVVIVERDGAPIKITAPGEVLVGDVTRSRLAWSELADRFGLARGDIPPYAVAELELLELVPDVPIDVVAAVTEEGFDDDGGLRVAPTRQPRAAHASILGVGVDATAHVDKQLAPRATSTASPPDQAEVRWYERVLAALFTVTADDLAALAMLACGGALISIAWAGGADRDASIAFTLGMTALIVGLVPWARVEPFYAREKRFGRAVHLQLWGRCFGFAGGALLLWLGLGIAAGALAVAPGDERHGVSVIATFALGAIIVMLIGDVIARPTLLRLAALSRKGATTGRLRVARPVTLGGRPAALGRYEVWKTGWMTDAQNRSKSTIRMTAEHYLAVPSIVLETEDGPLTIDTSELAWTSTVRFRDTTRTDGGYDVVQAVSPDARVVVDGAREEGPPATLRARGTVPVYLLAGPDDPARWAARVVRLRWLARVVMVASVPALVWSSGWLG